MTAVVAVQLAFGLAGIAVVVGMCVAMIRIESTGEATLRGHPASIHDSISRHYSHQLDRAIATGKVAIDSQMYWNMIEKMALPAQSTVKVRLSNADVEKSSF